MRQIIQRTAIHQPAVGNLRFGALAKDPLQIGNWIARMSERIGPLLLEIRLNHLPHNRVSQIFFALEVMKQCAFGRVRFTNDAIETTTLKSVFVKFVESSLEDFSSRLFWRSGGGRSHPLSNIQTSRYVSTFNVCFFRQLRSGWHSEMGFDFVGRVMGLS